MTSQASDAAIVVEGQELVLLSERALFWRESSTLLVADPHFGKAATFRAAGIPVPSGTTREGLARLESALARTGARRIVYLGDYLHARAGRAPETLRALAEWRARHREVEQLLVRGNHDRHAGDPPPECEVRCVDAPLPEAPFVLAHHPVVSPDGYVLAGHLHPGAALAGMGGRRERLACFWFRARYAVLPAFGDFTGLATIEPSPSDRVFVIAGQAVIAREGRGA